MRLSDLLEGCEEEVIKTANLANGNPEILGLTADSRQVQEGYLFAALPGTRSDGRAYIPQALEAGAVAILLPNGPNIDPVNLEDERRPHVRFILDDDAPRLFSQLAARFFGDQPETTVAVTGTNGKTSTCTFARQIWKELGKSSAAIGSLGVESDAVELPYRLTTPEPMTLHSALKDLADGGVTHSAMEASSHGITQRRLDGVKLKAAAFTNVSRDHLDYHDTMDGYVKAKLRLFTDLLPGDGTAVLNADAYAYPAFKSTCDARNLNVMTYGRKGTDIHLSDIKATPEGQELTLELSGRTVKVNLPLIGEFQAENALCALGLVLATGGDEDGALAALEHLEGAKGRVEMVAHTPSGGTVYIDYAHTPDAHTRLLPVLREHTEGELALVFGCGGDRDHGKRPEMGTIAQNLVDRVYVCDDNPRSEDPTSIRAAILAKCPKAEEIPDRGEAIALAIKNLNKGDVLVITGKGPDKGQIVKDQILPHSDYDEVAKAVEGLNS